MNAQDDSPPVVTVSDIQRYVGRLRIDWCVAAEDDLGDECADDGVEANGLHEMIDFLVRTSSGLDETFVEASAGFRTVGHGPQIWAERLGIGSRAA